MVLRQVLTTAAILAVAGCQTPFLTFSGGALRGQAVVTDSFSFAGQYRLLQLEVRPQDPYSVNLRVVVRDGNLYIDAAQRRRWHGHIKKNPQVRVKLGSKVYPARAIRVSDPEVTEKFARGRTIYQLVPRSAK
jgi:hypothetical protein